MSQNCVILNARTLSKRAAREAREAREARAHEKRGTLCSRARERASERGRREYVRAGKEEDARRRATGYLSLPVSYSAAGRPRGYQPVRRLSGFFCCLHIISWIKKFYFSATRDPSYKFIIIIIF